MNLFEFLSALAGQSPAIAGLAAIAAIFTIRDLAKGKNPAKDDPWAESPADNKKKVVKQQPAKKSKKAKEKALPVADSFDWSIYDAPAIWRNR